MVVSQQKNKNKQTKEKVKKANNLADFMKKLLFFCFLTRKRGHYGKKKKNLRSYQSDKSGEKSH